MPGRRNGRQNNWSGLYCRHGGPVYVLGIVRYRGEALKMDDCINCEFLEKCREGERMPCPWETVEAVYNPNIWTKTAKYKEA